MKSPMNTRSPFVLVALLMLGLCTAQAQNAQNAPQSMRFFVTSAGLGKGGDSPFGRECVVADAVAVEPVSQVKFPANRENNREF